MKLDAKKICTLAVSVSLAMILSFVESQIPPLSAVPGIKLGLSNIVGVFLLYTLGIPSAIAVTLIRVLLSALLFGNTVSLVYSLSGAALSLLVMAVAKQLNLFSIGGVSILGAIFHNVGQVAAAMIIMENAAIAVYLAPLLVSGTVAGLAVGILAALIAKRLAPHLKPQTENKSAKAKEKNSVETTHGQE